MISAAGQQRAQNPVADRHVAFEGQPSLVSERLAAERPVGAQILAIGLVVPVAFVLALVLPVVLIAQGRPLFYASTRAGQGGAAFRLWKIRTMRTHGRREAVLGGEAASDVTRIGHWLRRSRIDELPQIINLIRGDMVFVGARPPLPRYVAEHPEIYLPLLSAPPGITGLATVVFCHREADLLAPARHTWEVDRLYRRRCLPRKARLDVVYARRRGPGITLMILVLTLWRGRQAQRIMRRVRHSVERKIGWRT